MQREEISIVLTLDELLAIEMMIHNDMRFLSKESERYKQLRPVAIRCGQAITLMLEQQESREVIH